MSDFTKEELEEIMYLIDDREGQYGAFGKFNLGSKIQSMINDYDSKGIEAWHCEKCGHVQ